MSVVSSDIKAWDETIEVLAKKRSRIQGVEYDDLIQEGRMAVLLSLLGNVVPDETYIKNAMRRYIRNQKQTQTTTYELRT